MLRLFYILAIIEAVYIVVTLLLTNWFLDHPGTMHVVHAILLILNGVLLIVGDAVS